MTIHWFLWHSIHFLTLGSWLSTWEYFRSENKTTWCRTKIQNLLFRYLLRLSNWEKNKSRCGVWCWHSTNRHSCIFVQKWSSCLGLDIFGSNWQTWSWNINCELGHKARGIIFNLPLYKSLTDRKVVFDKANLTKPFL